MSRDSKIGDVFTIPVGDGRNGFGQVAGEYSHALYIVVFDFIAPLRADLEEASESALASPVKFAALTFDAKLHNGDWSIIRRAPVPESTSFPAYRLDYGTEPHVISYNEDRSRPATAEEADVLPNRSFIAPAALERALRSSLGLEPWLDIFDSVRPSPYTVHALFPDS